jgi:hypothetical protein
VHREPRGGHRREDALVRRERDTGAGRCCRRGRLEDLREHGLERRQEGAEDSQEEPLDRERVVPIRAERASVHGRLNFEADARERCPEDHGREGEPLRPTTCSADEESRDADGEQWNRPAYYLMELKEASEDEIERRRTRSTGMETR